MYFASAEAAVQRCFYKKVLWKYAANLQESTQAEVWFKKIALQFGMGVFL